MDVDSINEMSGTNHKSFENIPISLICEHLSETAHVEYEKLTKEFKGWNIMKNFLPNFVKKMKMYKNELILDPEKLKINKQLDNIRDERVRRTLKTNINSCFDAREANLNVIDDYEFHKFFQIKTKEEFKKAIDTINAYMSIAGELMALPCIMDMYLLPRVFRSFKEKDGSVYEAKNIITYGGDAHAVRQRQALQELGFTTVRSINCASYVEVTPCLDIRQFLPFFQG
jgi:hypothetical protein